MLKLSSTSFVTAFTICIRRKLKYEYILGTKLPRDNAILFNFIVNYSIFHILSLPPLLFFLVHDAEI